jgi:hypothetical protein
MGAATSIEVGGVVHRRWDERGMYHAHPGDTILVTRVFGPGRPGLEGQLVPSELGEVLAGRNGHSREAMESRALYPLAPSGSTDRMVMLMEALVEFLEAVEGNLHNNDEPDNRTPQRILEQLPCRRAADADVEKECYICLSHFAEDEQVRTLPCGHEFHVPCVDRWLLDVHRTCPCCRLDICASASDGEPKPPEDFVSMREVERSRLGSRLGSREMALAGLRRSAGDGSDATPDRRWAMIGESAEREARLSEAPSTGSLLTIQEAGERAASSAAAAHRPPQERASDPTLIGPLATRPSEDGPPTTDSSTSSGGAGGASTSRRPAAPPAGTCPQPSYTLNPKPYTLNPTPYTLNPKPYTLNPTPYTLHPYSGMALSSPRSLSLLPFKSLPRSSSTTALR